MGVAGLWDVIRPAGKIRSLTELSVKEGFEANPSGVRGFRVGIDASIWFFHAEYGREGENPVLRTLFFRCATLMHSPFLPLFVFDGPKRPEWKRGKKINRTSNKLIPGMKAIVESFGFEWRMAPGEAEAELAYLNRMGIIDGIFSDDVDNFLFGATTVIRNPSNNLSGNRGNPVLNAAGKDDKNHTKVFRMSDIIAHPDIKLTRGGLILIGLMSGGDYEQGGLNRCGTVTAHGLARCGFGDTLFEAANEMTREELQKFLVSWRYELCHELKTNSQGYVGRKMPSLAKSITSEFPNIDVLLSYTHPITSESMGREENNSKITWSKEPDLGKLAATCEFYFEWGYKESIIKRFRTVIWHSAILRILRRAVLDLDQKASAKMLPPETPSKSGRASREPVGTPSRMIARHFSSMKLDESPEDDEEKTDERLIIKIHSERQHVSTDGLVEYRLEIAPAQLVRIAESGIKGLRSPEGPDEWTDETEEDEEGSKETKKPPPNPESHMRVWMPACMVRLAEPRLVEDFEMARQEKSKKKAAKGRKVDSKIPTLDQSILAPRVRDLTKKSKKSAGTDIKSFFPATKRQNNIQKKLSSVSVLSTLEEVPFNVAPQVKGTMLNTKKKPQIIQRGPSPVAYISVSDSGDDTNDADTKTKEKPRLGYPDEFDSDEPPEIASLLSNKSSCERPNDDLELKVDSLHVHKLLRKVSEHCRPVVDAPGSDEDFPLDPRLPPLLLARARAHKKSGSTPVTVTKRVISATISNDIIDLT